VILLTIVLFAIVDDNAPHIPTLNPFTALFVGAAAGILSAGAAGYVAIRKVRSEVGHTDAQTESSRAEAAQTIVNAAKALVDPLRDQLQDNKREITRLSEHSARQDVRIERLENHIDILERLVREMGLTPPTRPR
jgi:gas vesicle protein